MPPVPPLCPEASERPHEISMSHYVGHCSAWCYNRPAQPIDREQALQRQMGHVLAISKGCPSLLSMPCLKGSETQQARSPATLGHQQPLQQGLRSARHRQDQP